MESSGVSWELAKFKILLQTEQSKAKKKKKEESCKGQTDNEINSYQEAPAVNHHAKWEPRVAPGPQPDTVSDPATLASWGSYILQCLQLVR